MRARERVRELGLGACMGVKADSDEANDESWNLNRVDNKRMDG